MQLVCFVITVLLGITCSRSQESLGLSETVENIIADKKYDPRTRPGTNTASPLNVFINIHINSISKISESNMDFSITMYLRQRWVDQRLIYAHKGFNHSISLGHRQFDRIWTPDLFVRNLKAGVLHDITVPNRLIRLEPDGSILYSQRLTLTMSCDMDLRKYPMDEQICSIDLGSYGYTTDDIVMKWTAGVPVQLNPSISLAEFELLGSQHRNCNVKFSTTGAFPCLKGQLLLRRRLQAYLLSAYLPSFLLVLLSWVSFWIDLDAVPARISLSVITVLTITTQAAGSSRGLSSVSSVKALDVWMAVCLVYVFASFIEYAIVNTLNRRQKELTKLKKLRGTLPSDGSKITNEQFSLDAITLKTKVYRWRGWWKNIKHNKALTVDVVSRVMFPGTFFIINLIYWPYYLGT